MLNSINEQINQASKCSKLKLLFNYVKNYKKAFILYKAVIYTKEMKAIVFSV